MDIVKNLKDYNFTTQQRIFVGFLKENINSYSCNEQITNKAYLKQCLSPKNDFTEYTVGGMEPHLMIRKIN